MTQRITGHGRCKNVSIDDYEAREIAFWKTSERERPESDTIDNLLHKAEEATIFVEKLRQFHELFTGACDVLELGGGQLWASCIVKRSFPSAQVTGTDISPYAIASVHKWEHVFQVTVDRKAACPSYHTPFEDRSFDLIFAFAAAHHFRRHRSTLAEIARLLRPTGTALYLYEPACRHYIYRAAVKRVNNKLPGVPEEDVLRYQRIERLGREVGLSVETRFAPTTKHRGPVETLYYSVLTKLPLLQTLLPCTADFVIRKADRPPNLHADE
jgi:SAM-dependent methyltransferase